MRLSKAEKNHLRRLVGYIRCEIGQTPEEFMNTMRTIAPVVGEPSPDAKERLLAAHAKSQNVPRYIRAAIKSLERALARKGDTVDGEIESPANGRAGFISGGAVDERAIPRRSLKAGPAKVLLIGGNVPPRGHSSNDSKPDSTTGD